MKKFKMELENSNNVGKLQNDWFKIFKDMMQSFKTTGWHQT